MEQQWKLSAGSSGGESSRQDLCTKAWGGLWKQKIPDRLKIFAWRVFHDALPVLSNRRRRGCETEMQCHQCGFRDESTVHILFECWWSNSLWKDLNIGWPRHVESSPADWVWHFMTERRSSDLTAIIMGAWLILKNRNLLVHGKAGWSVTQCVLKIKYSLEQFKTRSLLCCNLSPTFNINSEFSLVLWCDGSWNHKDSIGGFAAVVSQGDIILSCVAGTKRNCASSLECELRGLLAGLNLASYLALPCRR